GHRARERSRAAGILAAHRGEQGVSHVKAADRGLRMRLVAAARHVAALGLNHGKSGNVSARTDGGFLITPSGKSYDALGCDDLVAVEGGEPRGERKPSSEWRLH